MRILLDTHSFIWWDDNAISHLSSNALAAIQNKNNTLHLSLASIWEMQIKMQLGKLNFTLPLREKVIGQQRTNHLQLLSIRLSHIYTLEQLPFHHRDPFDRLLIAQALHENIAIVTHDSEFAKYAVNIIW